MNKEQAENRAQRYNRMQHHPLITYLAHPMQPTKWERDRWGVVQCVGEEPYPQCNLGVACV